MKTKIIVLVALIVLCCTAGYFFLISNSQHNEIAKILPSNSIAVLTVDNLSQALDDYSKFPWWDEAKELPFINQITTASSKVDSLISSGALQSKINQNPVYVSFHVTSNSRIEPLFFIGSKDFEWLPTNIKQLANLWFGNDLLFSSRVFNEKVIYEVDDQSRQWGFISLGDFLVISTNSILLEDVIRTEDGDDYRLVKEGMTFNEKPQGLSLILNSDRIAKLNSVFTGQNQSNSMSQISGLISVGVESSDRGIKFNGISLSGNAPDIRFLPKNASINVENFIPSSATVVRWFGIESAVAANLEGFNIVKFQSLQNSEICEVSIDLGASSTSKVILSEVSNVEDMSKVLEEISRKSRAEGDTLFRESFLNNEIRFINSTEFLGKAYNERYQTSGKPYYAFFNNVFIISDNIDALKTVLIDYDAENTWGRIPEKRRYLDNLIREANITQLNNFEYALDPLLNSFNPKWEAFFKEHIELFSSFENFNYQLNASAGKYMVSAELTFNESVLNQTVKRPSVGSKELSDIQLKTNAFGDTSLTTKPFVVKNHNTNGQEIIFQDELNQLYLADRTGNVLWKKKLDGKINGTIEQVDFYANRKLQYLMFTDSIVYLIDRNGDNVEGFPKPMVSELPVLQFTVVDYDNSKNYRYATTDRRGNVYLLDKEGNQLEGWSPKAMGSALRYAPEHIRIRGRDCFVIVETNGTVHLLTRMGEEYDGFPFNAGKIISGDYFIKQGPSFEESYIKWVTEDGEQISMNFNGSIDNRKQMFKPFVTSKFKAVRDKLNTGLLMTRTDGRTLTVFDQKGESKFEKELDSDGAWTVEYYNFRNDSELYVVQNLKNGDIVILNNNGEALLSKPGFTTNPVGILYYQNKREYELFVNFDNQMAIYTFAQ